MRVIVFYHILNLKNRKYQTLYDFYNNIRNSNYTVNSCFWLYQIFPFKNVDVLLWSTFDFEDERSLDRNLAIFASNFYQNPDIEVKDVLWGFTKPSIYSKTQKSIQEIDPFSSERKKYLVIYPFVKTAEWYLLKQDTRQGMMNEHIRIGRQYPSILQLLLYSFGLADQEFVVSYEMDSIVEFDKLVYDLRSSDARKYTLRDTPIYTAIYRKIEEFEEIFARGPGDL